MNAREYLDKHGFEGYQGEWFISIMEMFAKQQNKELNKKIDQLIEIDKERSKENKRILRYLNEY